MKIKLVGVGLVLALSGCGGSDTGRSGPSDAPANTCATKNASYLETLTELPGGTCGRGSLQSININADGAFTSSNPINCEHVSQTGCTATDTGCKFSSQGVDFAETIVTTFTEDGSSASGLLTLSSHHGNGESCASTYGVTLVRQ